MSTYNNSATSDIKTAEQPPGYSVPSSPGSRLPPAYDSGKSGFPTSPRTQDTSGSAHLNSAPYVAKEDTCQSLYINGTLVSGTFIQRKNYKWNAFHWFLLVCWILALIRSRSKFFKWLQMSPSDATTAAVSLAGGGKGAFDSALSEIDQATRDQLYLWCQDIASKSTTAKDSLNSVEKHYTRVINSWCILYFILCLQYCLALWKSWTFLSLRPSRNYSNYQLYFTFGSIALMALSGILHYICVSNVIFFVVVTFILWIVYFPASVALSDLTGLWARRWLPLYYEQVGNTPNTV